MSLFKPKSQNDSVTSSDSLTGSNFTVPQEPPMQAASPRTFTGNGGVPVRKRKLMAPQEPQPVEPESFTPAARPAAVTQPEQAPAQPEVASVPTPVPATSPSKFEAAVPAPVIEPPAPIIEPVPAAKPEPVTASFEPSEILEVPAAIPENVPVNIQSDVRESDDSQAVVPQLEPIIPAYAESVPALEPEVSKAQPAVIQPQPAFERSVSAPEERGDFAAASQAVEPQDLQEPEPQADVQPQTREVRIQPGKPGLAGSLRNILKKAKPMPAPVIEERVAQPSALRPMSKRKPAIREPEQVADADMSQDYQPVIQQPVRRQPAPARNMPIRPQQNRTIRRPQVAVENFDNGGEPAVDADGQLFEQPQEVQPEYRPARPMKPQRPVMRPHISIPQDIETQEEVAPEEFVPAGRTRSRYPEADMETDQGDAASDEMETQETDSGYAEEEVTERRMPPARMRRPVESYRQQRRPTTAGMSRRQAAPKSFGVKEKASAPDGIFGTFFKQKSREEIEAQKRKLEKLEEEKNASKRLGDIEKTYKEGLTTLKDLLAPASLKFESSYFELNGRFGRSFFVLTYPRFLSSNWLSFIIQSEGALDVSMFIYPIDSETILKKLKSKVGEIGSQIAINQEKGMVRDPMLETAYNDVESLRDDLMQGTEKYFRFALYFTLYASDLQELDKNSATLESALGAKLIVTKRALMQTQDGFNSTLPLGLDDLDVANNMNTSPLSTVFPFVSSDLTGNDGILYGINRHNNSLILFDRFAMENANSVVFAKSGAGKSYAVKLEVLRSLMVGTDVIIIDPENEYKHLADAVGGTYLSVSLNAQSRINPFDLPIGLEGEDGADILRSAVVNLLGLFNLMLGKLNPTEEALMDKAIWQTYAKKDITENSDFRMVEYPTMNDLVEILEGMVGAESLAQRLSKYTEGTFAGLFNQPTNVVLNNQLVVFSIRDLEDELRPIAMYIVLNYIWNAIRSELKKRILAVDEAWILMQHEDSARFLFSIAKRGRKYYMGLTTITQDVADFMASPYGKPIVTNSSIQLLLKQSPAAINVIAETFFLTEGEKYLLLESEVGEGIFFAGLKHAAIKIYASYVEDQIITTDPKQLLEQEQQQEQ